MAFWNFSGIHELNSKGLLKINDFSIISTEQNEIKKWISCSICLHIEDLQKRKIVLDAFDSETESQEALEIVNDVARTLPENLQIEIMSALLTIHYYDELSEEFKSKLGRIDWSGRLKTISLESNLTEKQKTVFLMEATCAVLSMPGHTVNELKGNFVKYLNISSEKAEELEASFANMVMLPILAMSESDN